MVRAIFAEAGTLEVGPSTQSSFWSLAGCLLRTQSCVAVAAHPPFITTMMSETRAGGWRGCLRPLSGDCPVWLWQSGEALDGVINIPKPQLCIMLERQFYSGVPSQHLHFFQVGATVGQRGDE